eukprot:3876931-Prymnesium_polylepis.1
MIDTARRKKRPKGKFWDKTASPLMRRSDRIRSPRACPTLRESISPHAGIDGNAWGTASGSEKRLKGSRFQY